MTDSQEVAISLLIVSVICNLDATPKLERSCAAEIVPEWRQGLSTQSGGFKSNLNHSLFHQRCFFPPLLILDVVSSDCGTSVTDGKQMSHRKRFHSAVWKMNQISFLG